MLAEPSFQLVDLCVGESCSGAFLSPRGRVVSYGIVGTGVGGGGTFAGFVEEGLVDHVVGRGGSPRGRCVGRTGVVVIWNKENILK